MRLGLGVKSDPIEYRFSFEWFFDLLQKCGITNVQLGTFTEIYFLPDQYFLDLRENAAKRGIRISSCFTSHRELGGFFTGNFHMEVVSRRNFERLIQIGALVGADYVGSNAGSVYREAPETKSLGIERYLLNVRELMVLAKQVGLKGLTLEPMSSIAEPPSLPEEIDYIMSELGDHHRRNRATTIPVYLCGDIAHGVADREGNVVHNNKDLFVHCIPYMSEFHFKNTDTVFNSTFGFVPRSFREKSFDPSFNEGQAAAGTSDRTDTRVDEIPPVGVVDLENLKLLIQKHDDLWPVEEVIGYLEIPGPKHGRDYSDYLLEVELRESLEALKEVFS